MSKKITQNHLNKQAIVYLRQSTQRQVENNTASTARQYCLTDRAIGLGWQQDQILVMDGDLGKTGTTTSDRNDFKTLISQVSLGNVGAVLALEASRFSRSEADWHRLIDICALTDTLVIDQDGIYNPNDFNDRVLLGFKGTWSHTELHGMKLRLQGARKHKAELGQLRCKPPIGYQWNEEGNLEFYPDESVSSCLNLFFRKFSELESAFKVTKYFSENKILFPKYSCWRIGAYKVEWSRLTYCRASSILNNPTYAGYYCYGKTKIRSEIIDGNIRKKVFKQKSKNDWISYIQNSHPAYIKTDEFNRNQEILSVNNLKLDTKHKHGPARKGAALLQGLAICGKCGGRLSVHYQGDQGCNSMYVCSAKYDIKACWQVAASWIDTAVIKHLLEIMNTNNINFSLSVLAQLNKSIVEEENEWKNRIERADFECQRAFRQYDAVEPENRLVARNLEAHWNQKLEQLNELKERYSTHKQKSLITFTQEQKTHLLTLAGNFKAIWEADTTTNSDRKQLLGLLIKQICLSPIDVPSRQTTIKILWHSGATSVLQADRPRLNLSLNTDAHIVEKIREMSQDHTDEQIADKLNGLRLKSRYGKKFNTRIIASIRQYHKIKKPWVDPTFTVKGEVLNGKYISVMGMANRLGVNRQVIHYWRRKGVLKGFQRANHGPWWIEIDRNSLMRMAEKSIYVNLNMDSLSTLLKEVHNEA
ncbi:MAG: recombinase family protein [Bacteroidetes bacterium]|nr:recombinase family protein [Bacteroidota bacterium]